MNYSKLDADLIEALAEHRGEAGLLPVLIQLRPALSTEEQKALSELRGGRQVPDGQILTLALEPARIAALSDEAWVLRLELSQQAYPR